MFRCDTSKCAGHFAKFSHCHAEALFDAWEFADESTGGNGYGGGSYALFILAEPTEFDLDDRKITIPAGNYIVHEQNSGMVWLGEYDTPEEARKIIEAAAADNAMQDTADGYDYDQF